MEQSVRQTERAQMTVHDVSIATEIASLANKKPRRAERVVSMNNDVRVTLHLLDIKLSKRLSKFYLLKLRKKHYTTCRNCKNIIDRGSNYCCYCREVNPGK